MIEQEVFLEIYVIVSYSWQTNTVRKGTNVYLFVATTVRTI
jgi:hypothetical protein